MYCAATPYEPHAADATSSAIAARALPKGGGTCIPSRFILWRFTGWRLLRECRRLPAAAVDHAQCDAAALVGAFRRRRSDQFGKVE
jgi:hypothetical protein